MIKLFKNFNKRDISIIIGCILVVVLQVWLELKLPDYMSEITKLVTTQGSDMNEVVKAGIFMLICALSSMISAIIVGYMTSFLSASFSLKIREMVFKKVQKFGVKEMKEFSTSSLITRTTNDVTQIEMLLAMGMQILIKAPIMAVWAISKIVSKSVTLSSLVGVGVIIILVSLVLIMLVVYPRFNIIQKLTDKINNLTRENLMGVRIIRAFNAEGFQEKRFEKTNDDLTETNFVIQKTFAFVLPIMYFVLHFLTLGIYFIGSFLIVNMGMTEKVNMFSNMVVFTSYGMQVIMSFLLLAIVFMLMPRARVSIKRINEVIDSELSIVDGELSLTSKKEIGTISFDNVSFKYPDADEYLIKNISFDVKQGETVAFIGSTGSGKSTLINLIPRFYDVTEGSIFVDGINVKDYKKRDLNNIIGYISQKPYIFTGTIKSNIVFGDNKEPISDEDVNKALDVAQATEFVSKMKDGVSSHIARGGTNISGGQKQRLSIARAVARKPEIFIFDDSFSALDYKTDSLLRKALKENSDATCLIVAQRIGTIINADKIIVLDKGECVGCGTHKELLKTCDVYKEIALSQLSEEELENA